MEKYCIDCNNDVEVDEWKNSGFCPLCFPEGWKSWRELKEKNWR